MKDYYIHDHELPSFGVLNADGTFAGSPCLSYEGACELARQEEGRIVFQIQFF